MNLEKKRELAKSVGPQIKSLIKKYGYETVNYVWQQEVANQRNVAKIEQQIKALQDKKAKLQNG